MAVCNNINEETVTLDREAVAAIRRALIVGLSSYGEVERLCNSARAMENLGQPVPETFIPMHPTGSDETIGQFADALAYLSI